MFPCLENVENLQLFPISHMLYTNMLRIQAIINLSSARM